MVVDYLKQKHNYHYLMNFGMNSSYVIKKDGNSKETIKVNFQ